MSVQAIEMAGQSMSISELDELSEKAVEWYQVRWEAQMAADLENGHLAALLDELDQGYNQGKTSPL